MSHIDEEKLLNLLKRDRESILNTCNKAKTKKIRYYEGQIDYIDYLIYYILLEKFKIDNE